PSALHLPRPRLRARYLLVSLGLPRVDGRSGAASRSAMGGGAMNHPCKVANLNERFFTERLIRQRNVSANTIASYRDTFRLLFMFAQLRLRKTSLGSGPRRSRCAFYQRLPR